MCSRYTRDCTGSGKILGEVGASSLGPPQLEPGWARLGLLRAKRPGPGVPSCEGRRTPWLVHLEVQQELWSPRKALHSPNRPRACGTEWAPGAGGAALGGLGL